MVVIRSQEAWVLVNWREDVVGVGRKQKMLSECGLLSLMKCASV